jgi:hypothetical protein
MRIMSKHPFSRRVVKQKVTETARVDDNRAGVEVVDVCEPNETTLAAMNEPTEAMEQFATVEDMMLRLEDDIRREEFDAMSPADQAIQVLAGADPDGIIRRRIAQENSRKLAKALDDARAFQERMNASHS